MGNLDPSRHPESSQESLIDQAESFFNKIFTAVKNFFGKSLISQVGACR